MLFFILISIAVLFTGCGNTPEKLTIGLVPTNTPAELQEDFRQIKEYLEQEMNMPVEAVVTQDYYGLIEGMKQKQIEIGWFGAFSYIAAEKELDLELMVLEYRKDFGTSYHSMIITRHDSTINNLEDLKGKKMVFVDPGSTSGFVMPFALFKSRDIDIENYFSEMKYSGNHDQVAFDVINGAAEAGAMGDLAFTKLISTGKIRAEDFKILWKSDEIPGAPYAARADLDKTLKDKFKTAMLSIQEKAPEAPKAFDPGLEKFIENDEDFYNGIRNIARILGDDYIKENFLKKK